MAVTTYALSHFVNDLRRITGETDDPRAIISALRPLARQLALAKTWLTQQHYHCDAEQGFGAHLLHEEPDHTLAVFAGAWLPGRGAPPHNHGTWAVVAGVDGDETNVFWTRVDDGSRAGYAELRKQSEKVFGPGDVVSFVPDSIHSVVNATDRVTVSLHVYGKHVNYTDRFGFDPERNLAMPFKVKVDSLLSGAEMMADGGQRCDVSDGAPVRSCASPARPVISSLPTQAGSRGSWPSPTEDLQVVGDHPAPDPSLHARGPSIPAPPQPMTPLERADAPLAAGAPPQRRAGSAGPPSPGLPAEREWPGG